MVSTLVSRSGTFDLGGLQLSDEQLDALGSAAA
jgi:hypothetical protein